MNSWSMEIVDDKENVNTDAVLPTKPMSVGDARISVSSSIWEAQTNEGQILRIGARSPFNQINLESIQNMENLKAAFERNDVGVNNEQKPKLSYNSARNSEFFSINDPKITARSTSIGGMEEKSQYNSGFSSHPSYLRPLMTTNGNLSSSIQNQIQTKAIGETNSVLKPLRDSIQLQKANNSLSIESSLIKASSRKYEGVVESSLKMVPRVAESSQQKLIAAKTGSDTALSTRSSFVNKLFMKEFGNNIEIEEVKTNTSAKNQQTENSKIQFYEDKALAKKSDLMEILPQENKNGSSIRGKENLSLEVRTKFPVGISTKPEILTPTGRGPQEKVQSEEKVQLNRFLDFEPHSVTNTHETPARPLRNSSEFKTPQSSSMKKSLLDVKSLSKNQVMQNIQSLIDANNSSMSSGLSTPLQSKAFRAPSSESSSMKKLQNSILRDSPNTVALHSSVNFLCDLKTSIHESLRALHNAFLDSKTPFSMLPSHSDGSTLEKSITTLAEKAKGFKPRNSQATFDDILKQIEKEAKEKPKQIDSLDVLLMNKLESEFKTKNIKEHQSETVKRILNKQSCLYRHTSTADRNLVYQLPAFLTKGLIVYVSTSISQMAEQILSLPESICGACYNGLSSKENNQQILELVRSGEVRILYVTPDKLLEVLSEGDLPTIDYVVIDEFGYNEDQITGQTANSQVIGELLNEKAAEWTLLILMPPSSIRACLNLCEIYQISEDSIFPIYLGFESTPKISISRDDEPNKALVWLLKNQKFGDGFGVVISTNLKRTAEELSAFLGHNGVKNQLVLAGKTEAQKLELYSAFTKNSDQVIVTVTGTDLGLDKGLIKRIIHYNMPRSPQTFAQEVLSLPKQANCHIFINEEEYFRERNSAFANIIYKEEIAAFVEKIFQNGTTIADASGESIEAKEKCAAGSLLDKRRRDGTMMPVKKSNSIEFNTFISKSLIKPKLDSQENKVTHEPLFLKISELCQQFKLPKENFTTIFELVEKFGDWIEYIGTIPYTLNVRFLQTASNSDISFRKVANIQLVSPLWRILQAKSAKFSGVVRINVLELASDAKLSAAEALKQIKKYN